MSARQWFRLTPGTPGHPRHTLSAIFSFKIEGGRGSAAKKRGAGGRGGPGIDDFFSRLRRLYKYTLPLPPSFSSQNPKISSASFLRLSSKIRFFRVNTVLFATSQLKKSKKRSKKYFFRENIFFGHYKYKLVGVYQI